MLQFCYSGSLMVAFLPTKPYVPIAGMLTIFLAFLATLYMYCSVIVRR